MHVCMHVCVCLFVCMYACMYVCCISNTMSISDITLYWMCLLSYGYLPWSVFSLLLGASTGNLRQGFIDAFSVGSQP